MPTVREACNDKSWRVRYMVADKFVEVSFFRLSLPYNRIQWKILSQCYSSSCDTYWLLSRPRKRNLNHQGRFSLLAEWHKLTYLDVLTCRQSINQSIVREIYRPPLRCAEYSLLQNIYSSHLRRLLIELHLYVQN